MCEETHRTIVVLEPLFFLTEVARVGCSAAALEAGRVFYVKHLMIKHIRDNVCRHPILVQLAI